MNDSAAFHPLDPLTTAEVAATTAAVRAAERYASLPGRIRFISIELREPEKDTVLAWSRDGGALPAREALTVLLAQGDGSTHEVVTSLESGEVTSWTRLEGVQPLAAIGELTQAEELVLQALKLMPPRTDGSLFYLPRILFAACLVESHRGDHSVAEGYCVRGIKVAEKSRATLAADRFPRSQT